MTDFQTLPACSPRRRFCLAAAALAAQPVMPLLATAQAGPWAFYEPRPRESPRRRKLADKMAIGFAVPITDIGTIARLAADVPGPEPLLNARLQLPAGSGFQPAQCDGRRCTCKLTLDIVYLGE